MAASPSLDGPGASWHAGLPARLRNRRPAPNTLKKMKDDRIDELIELIDEESEGLRTAEFLQTQIKLESLVGKCVTAATIEETRVAITTSDGCRYYFYGFLGSETAN
jgi:hypothetical protein